MGQQIKIWFPAIRGGSGVDIHTSRLAQALQHRGVEATVTWYSTYFQFAPYLLSQIAAPSGVNIIHALSWYGFAFKRNNLPLVVSEQLDVLNPIYRPYKSIAQAIFHQLLVRRFMTRSFAAAGAITAVSRATAASLAETIRVDSAQVITNFVDTEIFRPLDGRAKPGSPFRLLYVGNLTKRKGADLLTPIMRRLGAGFELRFTSGLRDGSVDAISANMVTLGKLTGDNILVRSLPSLRRSAVSCPGSKVCPSPPWRPWLAASRS